MGAFAPPPPQVFQPTTCIYIIKYYLNGAVSVTMKEQSIDLLALALDLDVL